MWGDITGTLRAGEGVGGHDGNADGWGGWGGITGTLMAGEGGGGTSRER